MDTIVTTLAFTFIERVARMLNRRGFLLSAVGLLTSSFVSHAEAFNRQTGRPLLIAPRRIDHRIYWYENGDDLLLSLGPYELAPPRPPTWREFFVSQDVRHNNPTDLALVWEAYGVEPANYDNQIDGQFWQDYFDTTDSPTARAYKLLQTLDLGPTLSEAGAQPHVIFHEGAFTGDNSRWVNAGDHLALSLLQARFIDLSLPIAVTRG
ncbi:hypothetical protein B5K06_08775 [Rhizobium grahamii]|uniref:Uncharacterized protein n=1 Tax=Rhizobium grahamii TaxID=1120045 RepID=A0A370KSL3_9HYPH|nr:hypothetical protein B5K06_08775 [Rhizobium grahamii]